jgi:transposase
MITYQNFIGIDIGKFNFVVSVNSTNTTKEFTNNDEGIAKFFQHYQHILENSLSILETTGGYEMALLLSLCKKNYSVHRANTRKVKNFIRSFGNKAKTDALDAKALALYGFERSKSLELYKPAEEHLYVLYELSQRRQDLVKMLAAEKNRLQAPRSTSVKQSCSKVIEVIEEQIAEITEEINSNIDDDPTLSKKKKVLKTIHGIGNIVANELVISMPELGTLNQRKIASLAGVAPRANDSGKYRGYRSTGYGRSGVKPLLFMAAMAARNSKSELKTYYLHLLSKGKVKMVALTALMRKIILIANARLRDLNNGTLDLSKTEKKAKA